MGLRGYKQYWLSEFRKIFKTRKFDLINWYSWQEVNYVVLVTSVLLSSSMKNNKLQWCNTLRTGKKRNEEPKRFETFSVIAYLCQFFFFFACCLAIWSQMALYRASNIIIMRALDCEKRSSENESTFFNPTNYFFINLFSLWFYEIYFHKY